MAGSFTYKSYNFTEKDPIIDEIRTVVQQHGSTYKDIHEHSGVSTSTLTNWFTGPTRRPQAASNAACGEDGAISQSEGATMIKYKVSFAISAETLFGLLGKLLPIEDLEVEELIALEPKPKPAHRLEKPAHRARQFSQTEGVNAVIIQALGTGPKRHGELRQAVAAAGYAGSGVGSRIDRLLRQKVITRTAPGVYEIADGSHVQTRRPQGGPVREFA